MKKYGVVIAGGAGERLWPISRMNMPKYLLSIDAPDTLLDQTIARLGNSIPSENIRLITTRQYQSAVQHSFHTQQSIMVEPTNRNTGPAILYACLNLYKEDPSSVVVFAPADAYIPARDYALFTESVEKALAFVEHQDSIVLLGVKPTYPSVGYGYIEHDTKYAEQGIYKVRKFHEKPSEEVAKFYVQTPHMLWNIGMFVGKVSVFIEEYKQAASDIYNQLIAWQKGDIAYDDIISLSIDCAVIERSNRIWVLPVDFAWYDVGNVDVFLSMKQKHQHNDTLVVAVESQNNIIDVQGKLVALIGIDDVCIVETSDVLLITKKNETEKVRSIVNSLKQKNYTSYL